MKNFFYVNGEFFPGKPVKIMNRWGNIVFEVEGYDNDANKFTGSANKGCAGDLPTGTYYYNMLLGDVSEAISGFFYPGQIVLLLKMIPALGF
jgi:hypothetical protein